MLFKEIIAIYCENHTEHINMRRVSKMQNLLVLKQVVCIGSTVL
jgi:hypothetical protein